MANTFTQIYIQIIFAVRNRDALIHSSWKERLHRYITGIVQTQKHKLIAINSVPNHLHLFIGMKPHSALSDLVRDIKTHSTAFVNDEKFCRFKFRWQEGFGAFSYSHSHIDSVVKYIINQERHHARKSFREEYLEFLRKFNIPYDEKYLFDWIE